MTRWYLTCTHKGLMFLQAWWLSLHIMQLPQHFDAVFITHARFCCVSIKKTPLNVTFFPVVSWWLIWQRHNTIPPQQKQKAAQMNRSRPPNLAVVEKECATKFFLNSFISTTLTGGFFRRAKWKKCLWRKISLSKEKPFEKFTAGVRQARRWRFHVCLFWVFEETCWTLLVQTAAWFELLAGWMSWSVHLNDRKAAYHVPHRQATDICHLQSFILHLPFSAPQHTPM